MHSCQKQAVTSAAWTGAQPGPCCPTGGTDHVGGLPLSLERGYVDQKPGRCFCSVQRNFPTWHVRRIASPPAPAWAVCGARVGEGHQTPTALNHSRRGNPRWALRGTFGSKLLSGFFHLDKLLLIRPDNFRNSPRLPGSFLWLGAVGVPSEIPSQKKQLQGLMW